MPSIDDVADTMREFLHGSLDANQFAIRYIELWAAIVADQDAAIAREPSVDKALSDLREKFRRGEVAPDVYQAKARKQYQRLDDVVLRPGSEIDRLLSHVSVEADAYREQDSNEDSEVADDRDANMASAIATERELRGAVEAALLRLNHQDQGR